MPGRLTSPIPPQAQFKRFTETRAAPRRAAPGAAEKADEVESHSFGAWLISEDADGYRVLDLFADDSRLSKRQTKVEPRTLADEAAKVCQAIADIRTKAPV